MTFLLGLVAGLIVGWVIEWIIDWQFWRAGDEHDGAHELVDQSDLQGKLEQARLEIADLQQRLDAARTLPSDGGNDDLTRIPGIGAVFSRRLNEAGIHTFAELAATSPEEIRQKVGTESWQQTDIESWITAAADLASPTAEGE